MGTANQHKPVLILGNGASLRNLHYAALPADLAVFRVNQFFFEERYFAGKQVDLALIAANFAVHEKFFTLQNLRDRGEYAIDRVVFQESNSGLGNVQEIERFYPTTARLSNLILANREMWWWGDFVYRQYVAYGQGPTNGVNLIVLALSLGYTQIYVGGIDFYVGGKGENSYGFAMDNKRTLNKFFSNGGFPTKGYSSWHSRSVDQFVIEKCAQIAEQRGGFVYSVGKESPLNQLLTLAPALPANQKTLDSRADVQQAKPNEYIDDIMVMPKLYFAHFRQQPLLRELRYYIKQILRTMAFLVKALLKLLRIYIYIYAKNVIRNIFRVACLAC